MLRLLPWFLLVSTALAAPPPGADPNGAVGQWFQSLHAPGTGESCCGLADCRHYPIRITGGHYEVQYLGEWLPVPDDTILKDTPNPTGDFLACVAGDYHYDGIPKPRVVCFVGAIRT